MSDLVHDLRYGLRMLARTPVVSAVAVLSLALGIAANVGTFAVVDAFLFAPFPYPEQERLVIVWEGDPSLDEESVPVAGGNFLALREGTDAFRGLAAYDVEPLSRTDGELPEQVSAVVATPDLLAVLGVRPALGRSFTPEDGVEGAPGVVVLHHDYWTSAFLADPGVLGREMMLDGRGHTVIGVLPEDFDFIPANVDLVRPSDLEAHRGEPRSPGFLVMGRLRDGVTLDAARAELQAAWAGVVRTHPAELAGRRLRAEPLREWFPGPTDRRLVLILTAVTLFGLLIATANVANLLLARAQDRRREVAVRAALGAGRGRVVRQLLTESVLLAGVAGAVGMVVGVFLIRGFRTAFPPEMPDALLPVADAPVVLAIGALSVVVGVLFGLAPALHAVGGGIGSVLGEGSRGGTAGRSRTRLRDLFVVGEFAVAVALLLGALIMVRGFDWVVNADPGFDPERLLTFELTLPEDRYPGDDEIREFNLRLTEALQATPGVTAVAAMSSLPRDRGFPTARFTVDGRPPPEEGREPRVGRQQVSPGFLEAMGVPLLRGRPLLPSDRPETPPVVVVNEAFVDRHFPDEDPLGRFLTMDGESREIVGVAATWLQARMHDPARGPEPLVLVSNLQAPRRTQVFAVRAQDDPAGLGPAVREAVRALDAQQPVGRLQTYARVLEVSLGGPRTIGWFLGAVGIIALLLAAMGIWGVISHSVVQRRRELGIRLALGAEAGSVVRRITGDGARLAALGLALGAPLCFLMYRGVSTALVGIAEVSGPAGSFAAVAGTLGAVALLASWLPARRAARIDPARTLGDA